MPRGWHKRHQGTSGCPMNICEKIFETLESSKHVQRLVSLVWTRRDVCWFRRHQLVVFWCCPHWSYQWTMFSITGTSARSILSSNVDSRGSKSARNDNSSEKGPALQLPRRYICARYCIWVIPSVQRSLCTKFARGAHASMWAIASVRRSKCTRLVRAQAKSLRYINFWLTKK